MTLVTLKGTSFSHGLQAPAASSAKASTQQCAEVQLTDEKVVNVVCERAVNPHTGSGCGSLAARVDAYSGNNSEISSLIDRCENCSMDDIGLLFIDIDESEFKNNKNAMKALFNAGTNEFNPETGEKRQASKPLLTRFCFLLDSSNLKTDPEFLKDISEQIGQSQLHEDLLKISEVVDAQTGAEKLQLTLKESIDIDKSEFKNNKNAMKALFNAGTNEFNPETGEIRQASKPLLTRFCFLLDSSNLKTDPEFLKDISEQIGQSQLHEDLLKISEVVDAQTGAEKLQLTLKESIGGGSFGCVSKIQTIVMPIFKSHSNNEEVITSEIKARKVMDICDKVEGVIYSSSPVSDASTKDVNRGELLQIKLKGSEFIDLFNVEMRNKSTGEIISYDHSTNFAGLLDLSEEGFEIVAIDQEYFPGQDLVPLLQTPGDKKGFPIKEKREEVALKILNAIDKMHSQGVVHNDLSPRNIMYTHENGEVIIKIIDFGMAEAVADDECGRVKKQREIEGFLDDIIPKLFDQGETSEELRSRLILNLKETGFEISTGNNQSYGVTLVSAEESYSLGSESEDGYDDSSSDDEEHTI